MGLSKIDIINVEVIALENKVRLIKSELNIEGNKWVLSTLREEISKSEKQIEQLRKFIKIGV